MTWSLALLFAHDKHLENRRRPWQKIILTIIILLSNIHTVNVSFEEAFEGSKLEEDSPLVLFSGLKLVFSENDFFILLGLKSLSGALFAFNGHIVKREKNVVKRGVNKMQQRKLVH